jgi:ribonuclease HIII
MTQKQDAAIAQLRTYLVETGLELLSEREIDYGRQFKISNGTDTCLVNIYTSGKINVGGKKTALKQQTEVWKNLQQAQAQIPAKPVDEHAAQSRTTKFIVAQAKIDKIRSLIQELPGEITWREGDSDQAQVYQAEVRANGDKVVITQYRTGTLLVQGRASDLFDLMCDRLDQKLSQSIADRATRYIPEESRQVTLDQMSRPDTETVALSWLIEQLGQKVYDFLHPHDRETLLSGAALLQAVREIKLVLPDYSVLVMPFVRAYEGFLVKLFIHIGLADAEKIERNVRAVQVGRWLEELPDQIADLSRHGHIVDTLKNAWTSSRHPLVHSDHVRQAKLSTLDEADIEICGVIIRAFKRGFDNFVEEPIKLKRKADKQDSPPARQPVKEKSKSSKKQIIQVEGIDEARLLQRLNTAGYTVEPYEDPNYTNKWRIVTDDWKVFCPREPGDTIVVKGPGREDFMAWFHSEEKIAVHPATPVLPAVEPHIGVDEAGKGDYFGPLTVAAVYVTSESALDLIRWGVRDSKKMSNAVIAELALKIRERCPNVVHVLMPPEYNAAYERHQNLNRLLAEAHAQVIEALAEQTDCRQVVDDQFAAPHVLEEALAEREIKVNLEQRTGGESDVAVAAASILARESFVAAIEDFRIKAEMDVPLGSSSPKVVQVGRAIVRRWGEKGLERIAKLHFKTTDQIKSARGR